MKELNNGELRDAFRLTEAALSVAALGSMFSPEATKAAGEYLLNQSFGEDDPEKSVLVAIANYLFTQSRED